MVTIILIVLAIIVISTLIFYFISLYNELVNVKLNVAKAWANIDVLFKQRHDVVPKLVEICTQYMSYEKELLHNMTELRTKAETARTNEDINLVSTTQVALQGRLNGIFAVAENYPDLKANHNFIVLEDQINLLEKSIADRRELYNDSVNIYNVRIQQVPYNMLAPYFHFTPADLLHFSDEEKADVDIKSLFNKP